MENKILIKIKNLEKKISVKYIKISALCKNNIVIYKSNTVLIDARFIKNKYHDSLSKILKLDSEWCVILIRSKSNTEKSNIHINEKVKLYIIILIIY